MDVKNTIRKFFPAMSIHETMLHILYSKKGPDDFIKSTVEPDYSNVIDDLIKKGYIVKISGQLKFTNMGLERISCLREMRGL